MGFERTGNEICMQEFMIKPDMFCIIMVLSGTLVLDNGIMSLE